MSLAPAIPQAPEAYDRSRWQQILEAIRGLLQGVFRAGQDVRLLGGERLSLKSAGGTEVFVTVGDNGELLTPTAGAERVVKNGDPTLTLDGPGFYVFTGTTATWTLPDVAAGEGWPIRIKNRGSGDLTVQRAGSDHIYTSAAVTSVTVLPGASLWLRSDGDYWEAERFRAPYG